MEEKIVELNKIAKPVINFIKNNYNPLATKKYTNNNFK